MYKVDQLFIIKKDGEDAITQVGSDPDNSDFIKISQISSSGSYYDSLIFGREEAIKVAEAILKLTEMR